jgi:cytochrome c oxidase subunit IV
VEAVAERNQTSAPGRRGYLLVFAVLLVMTISEVVLTTLRLPKSITVWIFLATSVVKAGLVAAFFMHLRYDSRVYMIAVLIPVALVLIFAFLMIVSSIGGHL